MKSNQALSVNKRTSEQATILTGAPDVMVLANTSSETMRAQREGGKAVQLASWRSADEPMKNIILEGLAKNLVAESCSLRARHWRGRPVPALSSSGGTGTAMIRDISAPHLVRPHLAHRNVIEIVDVLQEPMRLLEVSVFKTPTLLKLIPAPARKILCTLSRTAIVNQALRLKGDAS